MRRAVITVLALGVLGVSLGFGFVGRSGADSAVPFVKGAATAHASSIGLNIHQGNGNVGFTAGSSTAQYRETYSSASSKPLDLALLKILLGESSRCPGSTVPVPIPDASLPLELQANSLQANLGTPIEGDALFPGVFGAPSPGVAGHGTAVADDRSGATATTSNPTSEIVVMSLVDPSTKVSVSLEGNVRRAVATSSATRLVVLGGLLTIEHPTWTAVASSGAATTAEGSFTSTGGTLFGLARTPSDAMNDLAGLGELLHGVLGFVGAALDLPKVTIEGPKVSVSPIRLHLSESPFGKQVLGPFMAAPLFGVLPSLDSTIKSAFDDAAKADCDNKRLRQIIDIVVEVLKGNGEIEIPVGGVVVSTDDTPPPVFDDDTPVDDPTLDTTTTAVPVVTAGGRAGGPAGAGAVVAHTTETRSPSVDETIPPATSTTEAPTTTTTEVAAVPSDNARSKIVNFAQPVASTTRTIPGGTGGAAVVIGVIIASLALGGFGAERLLTRRARHAMRGRGAA